MQQPEDSHLKFASALQTRREALQKMGGTVLFLMATGGVFGQSHPSALKARKEPFQKLTALEAATLEALGDTLLPGAAQAGIAYYVDRQLASATPLLMLRYLDFPMPFIEFYQQGLGALEALAQKQQGNSFSALTSDQQIQMVREISGANPDGWAGPPAPLFYFTTRNDAMDVYYGTPEGFGKLGVPYMPHIAPQQKW